MAISTGTSADDVTSPDVTLPVAGQLEALHGRLAPVFEGSVATYIPALASADPAWFGISIVTVDGMSYDIGETSRRFTIQSISKAFTYGMALDHHGTSAVNTRVGVEPTGNPFNSISVDESTRRPYNPMVNSGAILTTSLLPGETPSEKRDRMIEGFRKLLGRTPEIDQEVFASERATGDRNRAIAYFLRTFDMLPVEVDQILDVYFQQCSILVDAHDLAVMGATLANDGVNPITGEEALRDGHVTDVLSVMATCGMYDFAGEWVYRVGMPAKSGVSGGIVAVLPGQLGIGVFSPPLDGRGNSVRGIAVCEALSRQFGLHFLRTSTSAPSIVRRMYRGDVVQSKRVRTRPQAEVLQAAGDRIAIYELQGDVFFTSADVLSRMIAPDLGGSWFVVLDTKRVGRIDAAGGEILRVLGELASARGTTIVTTSHPAEFGGLVHRVMPNLDDALEWCEDEILRRGDLDDAASVEVKLEEHELFVGLEPHELAALAEKLLAARFSRDDVIFEEGDAAASLYLLTSGCVSVQLSVDDGARRLATLDPGSAFGEMAVLDGGVRSTTVVAEEESVCLVLTRDALDELAPELPTLACTIYANLARSLSRRLRKANAEIRALES